MTTIKSVKALELLDSRGNPTVGVTLFSKDSSASWIVPSGASTGSMEALELRDGGSRFSGKGVRKAVSNINSDIGSKISGQEFQSQDDLDTLLKESDGTPNKSSLGANSILAVSAAFCKLQSVEKNMPLYEHLASLSDRKPSMPKPQMNILNGGVHAGLKNDIQEHMIVPQGRTFSESLEIGCEIYHELKKTLMRKFGSQSTHVADEGGFAPRELKSTEDRLEIISSVVAELGYSGNVTMALDAAASEFFDSGAYSLGGKNLTSGELVDYYNDLAGSFNLSSIEDGLAEDDWQSWTSMTKQLGGRIQIVGDDLLVTNPILIKKALELKACNALLLKLNQIGTVTESLKAAEMAQENGWNVIVSHRSGETEDPLIADLAVGVGSEQCKFGAPARGERTSKYNRLLQIEQLLTEQEK